MGLPNLVMKTCFAILLVLLYMKGKCTCLLSSLYCPTDSEEKHVPRQHSSEGQFSSVFEGFVFLFGIKNIVLFMSVFMIHLCIENINMPKIKITIKNI